MVSFWSTSSFAFYFIVAIFVQRGSSLSMDASRVRGSRVAPPDREATVVLNVRHAGITADFPTCCVGVLLIFLAIPVLWVNERRSARYDSLFVVGLAECVASYADKACADNRGSVVHIQGVAQGAVPVQDRRFRGVAPNGCLRFRSTVQVFQWNEQKNEKSNCIMYNKNWSNAVVKSDGFSDLTKRNTVVRPQVEVGTDTVTCEVVNFGDAFSLPRDLVEQLSGFVNANVVLGKKVEGFRLSGDHYYFPPARDTGPEIGDMRVLFEFVPAGDATVVALHVESKGQTQRDTFLPYRIIPRGISCFKMSTASQRAQQIIEGSKDAGALFRDDRWTCGPFSCVLCCCLGAVNCVNWGFSLAPPQIYNIFPGSVEVAECWLRMRAGADMKKRILRVVSWAVLFCGFSCLFHMVLKDLKSFQFPWSGSFVVAFTLTVSVSSLLVSGAFLWYRQSQAVKWGMLGIGVILFPFLILIMSDRSKQTITEIMFPL